MVSFPSPDRADIAVVASSVVLLFFAYVVYPVHIFQVLVWFTIFSIYVGWMAYALHKVAFGAVE